MKKTYIILVVLVLVLLAWSLLNKGNKAEAPITTDNTINSLPDSEKNLQETTPTPTDKTTSVPQSVKEFTVLGDNFSFKPNLITVKKGDRVKIVFKNNQGFHDFVIDEYGVATKQLKSPGEEVLEFTADKTGTFEYYCSVGSHRAMGMFGTLKVE